MPFLQLITAFTLAITGIFHPVGKPSPQQLVHNQVLAAAINRPTVTPFPSSAPTGAIIPTITNDYPFPYPLIDCVGPDGKHLHITQQACDNFNNSWHTTSLPTASPYGQATKIADHTYELKVVADSTMATPQEVFAALNNYRQKNGSTPLAWNANLTSYAQSRADFFSTRGALDGHAGFMDFINNQDGFTKLGFNHLGENAAYAGPLTGIHLIEEVFAADAEHNGNQLNNDWTNVGIGISGIATDVVFGSSPH
jgi:uncharacterized protein YkwD